MNKELPDTGTQFDSDLESGNDVSDVKDKSNLNDDDSNVVILNENGEEVEGTMHDDNDIITSDNNEDKNEDIIFKKCNITQKIYVLSVVYEAHFFKTNMNIFKDLSKNKK